MFILYANKNQLTVHDREPLTSGSVNVYAVRFEFSPDWDGLIRTAVFRAGAVSCSILLDDSGQCTIPWEVLAVHGRQLTAGVCGTRSGEIALPTAWADLGAVLEGAAAGDEAHPPTPELWAQELARKGDTLGYTEDGRLGLYAGDKQLSAVKVSGGGGGADWGVGHGLAVRNGSLTVVTTNDFKGDNTLPMTAAGVQASIGNIEALLGTI